MSLAAKDKSPRCRILVVDDEEDLRLLLEREIRDLGHAVVGVADAKEAIAEMEQRDSDIVITDVRMPGMDGIELTRWIKGTRPETDVIIMTGYASVDTAAEALRLGAFDYLMKPFGEIELVTSSINRAVEKRALEKALKERTTELGQTNASLAAEIIERKIAEEKLARHASALEATNRELESFSYSVSHDLRAPLRSINGFSQALLEDCGEQLGEVGKDYLNRVRASSEQMADLIDDLLRLSRITRGEMTRQAVDLSSVGLSIEADLERSQPERQVQFVVAEGLVVDGDERLLRVVLQNLLANAWKFTAKRSPALIEFGAEQHNGTQAFFVRDNGAGFDMAYADKLFGAFQRLHSPAEFEGTGIGLATVQRIIHRHGGRVWAEGAVEGCATFYFTL